MVQSHKFKVIWNNYQFLVNFWTCDVMHRMMPSHHHSPLTICTKRLIKCLMCHMTFADGSSIIAHNDTAHAPSLVRLHSSWLECEISGTMFADSSNIRRHFRSASATCDVKMIQCDLCPTSFKSQRVLWIHLIVRHLAMTDALTDARQTRAWRRRQELSD